MFNFEPDQNNLHSYASNTKNKEALKSIKVSRVAGKMQSKALPAAVLAATMPLSTQTMAIEGAVSLPETVVVGQSVDGIKNDYSANVKQTQKLVDTPQTISVIDEEIIKEQKATTLTEALRNTPGITMQMGENGHSTEGDAISMRGFSVEDQILQDGIKDTGAITRDTFNTEQVEVTKGSAGSDIGRGASAGTINVSTKLPNAKNASEVTASLGTAKNLRITADVNNKVSDNTAFRLNALHTQGGVDGRHDIVQRKTSAIAPSIAWGLGTDTRVYAYSEHVRQENTADGGVSTIGMDGYFRGPADTVATDYDVSKITGYTAEQVADAINKGNAALNNAKAINPKNYYGVESDLEKSDSDKLSFLFEKDISDNATITNLTRYGKTSMQRTLNAPYNVYNQPLSTGRRDNVVMVNQDMVDAGVNPEDPSTWQMRVINQSVDRENEVLLNQTNVNVLKVATGSLLHDITAGVELSSEKQLSRGVTRANVPYVDIYSPNPYRQHEGVARDGSYSEGKTDTFATYVFDTMSIGERVKLSAGARIDNYDTEFETVSAPDAKTGISERNKLTTNGKLFSYKGGLLVKPTKNTSIYASYGVAETPPGSANFSLATSGRRNGPHNNPNFDPQKTQTLEAGVKADVLNGKLALTAAYYETTHKNDIGEEDTATGKFTQYGERTVKGVELSAVGEILPNWRISAGLQTMDNEVVEGASPEKTGESQRWSPDLSATLWTSYDVNDKLTLGAGARHMGEQQRVTSKTVNLKEQNMPVIPAYIVFDLMAQYNISPSLNVQLNAYNVADEFYLEKLNNGGARAQVGAPRSAKLSVNYKF